MTNKTRRQAMTRAWIILVSLVLAACGSAATASSSSPGFTGYDWQVVAIGHSGKVTPIPARLAVGLQFSPGGQFGAFDGIHGYSGTYRATRDGFTTGPLTVTGNGYVGDDSDILLGIRAMASFGNAATYPVRLTGDGLVVDVGSYTLICHRAGPPG